MTDEQVAGAKKQLLSDVYTLMEDPLQLVENMGVQVRMPFSIHFCDSAVFFVGFLLIYLNYKFKKLHTYFVFARLWCLET